MRRARPGRLIGVALALMLAPSAAAAGCEALRFDGAPYTICRAAPGEVRLFLNDASGRVIGTFARLRAVARARGLRIRFAMNGGMYHPDRRPVGLYVEEGRQLAPLVTAKGPGNFGLLPNGVLCIAGGKARIMETGAFAARRPQCRLATQSGPMLVVGGALHPRLLPESRSRFVRNGVGVGRDGRLLFAISDAPVSFHAFARLFRDRLGVRDALFLDGKVSRLFAPAIGRADFGLPMGPIIAAVAPGGG